MTAEAPKSKGGKGPGPFISEMAWNIWEERFDFFIKLRGITDAETKKFLFFTEIGPIYEELRQMALPDDVRVMTMAEIKELMTERFGESKTVAAKRDSVDMCLNALFIKPEQAEHPENATNAVRMATGRMNAQTKHPENAIDAVRMDIGLESSRIKTQNAERASSNARHGFEKFKGRPVHQVSAGKREAEVDIASVVKPKEVKCLSVPPAFVQLKLEKGLAEFELDCGADVSLIAKDDWIAVGKPQLKSCSGLLAYGGKPIKVLGSFMTKVAYLEKEAKAEIYVVDDQAKNLCGRDLIKKLQINLNEAFGIGAVQEVRLSSKGSELEAVLQKHAELKADETASDDEGSEDSESNVSDPDGKEAGREQEVVPTRDIRADSPEHPPETAPPELRRTQRERKQRTILTRADEPN
ncbi:hypothetical protein GPALN_012319 [Globodera pallida]|nr:hypothetical protein GPALN_012319 [Globodera pallida]